MYCSFCGKLSQPKYLKKNGKCSNCVKLDKKRKELETTCSLCKGKSTKKYLEENKMCGSCVAKSKEKLEEQKLKEQIPGSKTTENKAKTKNNLKKKSTVKKHKSPNYSKTKISSALRSALWRAYFTNKLDGTCYCCNRLISYDHFECGHIIPESKGGPTEITNLKPVCGACNKSMGSTHMEEFKKKLAGLNSNGLQIAAIEVSNNPAKIENIKIETIEEKLSRLETEYSDLLSRIEKLEAANIRHYYSEEESSSESDSQSTSEKNSDSDIDDATSNNNKGEPDEEIVEIVEER